MSFFMRTLATDLAEWINRFFPETAGSLRTEIINRAEHEMSSLAPRMMVDPDKPSDTSPDCVLRIPDISQKGEDWFFILNRSMAQLLIMKINPVTPTNGLDLMDLRQVGTALCDEQQVNAMRAFRKNDGPYRHHTLDKSFIVRMVKEDTWCLRERIVDPVFSAVGVDAESIRESEYDDAHVLHSAHDALKGIFKFHRRHQIRSGIRSFMGQMDPRALKIMRRGHVFEERLYPAAIYEWLTGYHEERQGKNEYYERGSAASSDAIQNRQDLGEHYPGLLNNFTSLAWRYWDVQRKIDSGLIKDIDAVRETLIAHEDQVEYPDDDSKRKTFPDDFIRSLRAKGRLFFDGYNIGPNPFQNFCGPAFLLAASLPPAARPTNAAEWAAYNSLFFGVRNLSSLTDRPFRDVSHELARLVGKPSGIPPSLFSVTGDTVPARIASLKYAFDFQHNQFSHCMDFMMQLGSKIIIPMIAQTAQARGYSTPSGRDLRNWTDCNPLSGNVSGEMAACLYRGRSLEQIFNQAVRWHDNGAGLNVTRATGRLDTSYAWPALIQTLSMGDVRFEPLNRTQAIIAKADEYKNCVYGYTRACVIGHQQGFSHIIELIHANGSRALMELYETSAGGRKAPILSIGQIEKPVPEHRAAGGEGRPTADPWAWEAANMLLERLNDPNQRDIQ